MALEVVDIQNKLEAKFGEQVSNFRMEYDVLTFDADKTSIVELVRFMKEDETLRFNFLTDLCGIHYPENDEVSQFAVTYLMHNWIDNVRVRIKTYLSGNDPKIETMTSVFAAANWMERETYDFFGIQFEGHPDLRRILNVDTMTSFPLRKEYALEDSGRSDKDDRFFGRTPHNAEQVK